MKRRSIISVACLVMFVLMLFSGASAAVKEITIWTWGAPDAVILGLIENSWPLMEKEFGVKIKHELFPGISETEFVTKVVNAVRFGTGPDLIEANAITLSTLASQGFLQPVPASVVKSLQEKLLPSYKNAPYLWDEDGYKKPFMGAIVRDAGGQIVWWNEEMYKEAGLDRSARTWDEVFEFGKKLTKYGADGLIEISGFFVRTAGHGGGIGDKFTPYFLSAGGGSLLKIEDEKVKANFNTSAGIAAAQFYLDVLYKYNIDAIGIPGDVGGWEKGQTATVSARRFWVPLDVKRNAPDMYSKLRAGSIPVAREGLKSITTSHIYGLTVNPTIDSETKEFIWKLCERLNQFDMVKLRSIDTMNWLPYREAVTEAPFTEELWQEVLKSSQNTIPRLEAPKFSVVQAILGDQLNLIFAKEKSIEAGLSTAAEEISELYEDVMLKEL